MISLNESEKRPNKKYLLERINQEDVFRDFGIPYSKEPFKNPIRKEKKPSCQFKINKNNELILIDYSGWFYGNCFDFVCFIKNITFVESLNLINEMYVKKENNNFSEKRIRKLEPNNEIINYSKTEIITKHNDCYDLFWSPISKETLNKFKVKTVEKAWLSDKIIYNNDFYQKCFVYYFGFVEGIHRIKLYFPNSKFRKFITNSREIEGYKQLPKKGDLLVITKSLKDVMMFYEFGITAISPPSENFFFKEELINELKLRFKKIIVIYDFDKTGIKGAEKLKNDYSLHYLFLQNKKEHYKIAKDVFDISKKLKNEDLINLKSKRLKLNQLIKELRKVYDSNYNS